MRPVLRPGLRLHEDPQGRAALVERDRVYRLDAVTAALVSRLDGVLDEATLLRRHPGPDAAAAWDRLRESRVVVDVEAPAELVRCLPQAVRAQAMPEASALLADDPATARGRWQRRRAATVVVAGDGVAAGGLVSLLRRSAVGAVHTVQGYDGADVTVLAHDHEPGADTVARLMRDSRAHLLVGMRGTEGVVGPFVRPGATPCTRCVDLARAAADPAWGALRDRLAAPGPRITPTPAGAAVTATLAALAAADVLAELEGRDPATLGRTLAVSLRQPVPTDRRWPTDPACGCAWQPDPRRGQWTP
jgi:bacteriocin biosynthesis cyclodehydratase domain-containing protein